MEVEEPENWKIVLRTRNMLLWEDIFVFDLIIYFLFSLDFVGKLNEISLFERLVVRIRVNNFVLSKFD